MGEVVTVPEQLFGRRKIYASTDSIDRLNVLAEVNKALELHYLNMYEEEYLYWYRRGMQPILMRKKEVRPDICNKIVINNAEQVCVFKNGYFLQKPTSYVSRRNDEGITEKVRTLNEYVYNSGKLDAENEVVNWFHTVGLGVLFIEPNSDREDKERPVYVYALDPRSAFVVYSRRPGNKPVMGVNVVDVNGKLTFDVFTRGEVFRLTGGYTGTSRDTTDAYKPIGTAYEIVGVEPNYLGSIPMVEYQYDENRMASFEAAIPIMNLINTVESNRADGVEQQIQQLCVATNCQFADGVDANTIMQAGMICLKSTTDNKAEFKILDNVLDQAQTQVTLDNLYDQMLFKCSMPSTTSGGKSTSDTGTAVYLRDGYQIADTAARNTTDLFTKSNRYFDEVFLKALNLANGFKLDPSDFALRIERNSTSNLLVKSQSALNMKELGLAPQIVFERSGLSSDPLSDIDVSKEYIKSAWSTENPDTGKPDPKKNGEDGSTGQGNYVAGYYR